MILSCTPPPSANRMWTSNHRKTPEYRAWERTAGWEIKLQRPKGIADTNMGSIAIALTVPANGRRDLDNHCKPVLDLLTSMALIDGDRFKTVKRITMEWHDKPAMLIQIEPWLTPWPSGRTESVTFASPRTATGRKRGSSSTPS